MDVFNPSPTTRRFVRLVLYSHILEAQYKMTIDPVCKMEVDEDMRGMEHDTKGRIIISTSDAKKNLRRI